MNSRLSLVAASVAASLLLSGCALLGGGKPVQLYRLNATGASPAPVPSSAAASRTILLLPVRADPAIEGDRMLATSDAETSYVAKARWISPVPVQIEQALRNAIRQRHPSIALVDRRDGLSTDRAVQLTISRFEARFPAAGVAPLIVLEGEARLIDLRSRASVATLDIGATRQAASGDVNGMVAAFDGASAEAVMRAADWLAR